MTADPAAAPHNAVDTNVDDFVSSLPPLPAEGFAEWEDLFQHVGPADEAVSPGLELVAQGPGHLQKVQLGLLHRVAGDPYIPELNVDPDDASFCLPTEDGGGPSFKSVSKGKKHDHFLRDRSPEALDEAKTHYQVLVEVLKQQLATSERLAPKEARRQLLQAIKGKQLRQLVAKLPGPPRLCGVIKSSPLACGGSDCAESECFEFHDDQIDNISAKHFTMRLKRRTKKALVVDMANCKHAAPVWSVCPFLLRAAADMLAGQALDDDHDAAVANADGPLRAVLDCIELAVDDTLHKQLSIDAASSNTGAFVYDLVGLRRALYPVALGSGLWSDVSLAPEHKAVVKDLVELYLDAEEDIEDLILEKVETSVESLPQEDVE